MASLQSSAMEYTLKNVASGTPGGIRFDNNIGFPYSLQTMMESMDFVWRLFRQEAHDDRKSITRVSLILENMNDLAHTSNGEIYLSASYLERFSGVAKAEFTGLLYYAMACVWQWDGAGQAPRGLVQGIADFVRLRSGYVPAHWAAPGQGNRWDQGYDVTARFLDYCESLRNGFVAELNKKMRTGYSNGYFVELLGKSVDQLWNDYKAKYAT
ncbi:uncharacterized protein LOC115731386 [Rhodamnia argentea]|uniref:Uncharacterized protein LOC115731386 n=1 Tax=Rhodamnia argentea TaxID=178133 RepID=A0A8B8N650_9MYRT|nr:uncharacterized protein LOC115731386 [Rhodamnia argentea]